MAIADLKPGGHDLMGEVIKRFYGLKPPEYAVYSTTNRLLVWYADDPTVAAQQRKGMAQLSQVRGEINGLVDGWRESGWRSAASRAVRYDRRVADALVVALERDIDSAETILRQIEHDLLEERTGWARLEYLLASLALSMIFAIFVWCLPSAQGVANHIWHASAAGALGAFFSISLGIRTRTVLPDLQRISNVTDAALRVLIGFIAAGVLISLVDVKAVTVSVGSANTNSADPGVAPLVVLIIGFLAGFSERLVPDLLAKSTAVTASPSLPPAPSQTAAQEGSRATAAAAPSSATPPQVPPPATGDGTPPDASDDHCICTTQLDPSEATGDRELPRASGGVAAAPA